ncbi:MAG: heat-inducible transcription repressor HrcA [Ignavibacteriae bacterium]|nr:heat-inducible transcription repressor HrcA [Ignavibacteriota bacterium]
MVSAELSEREKTVLRYVVHDFIDTAVPIGSRYISRRHEDELSLSAASIRNVMSDLEYLGYINHPHISAGRVPTDLGYRFYLDALMQQEVVSDKDQKAIRENLGGADESEDLFRQCSKILSRISKQLCVVTSPQLSRGIFEKLELVQISSNRLMVIMSLQLGLVRTIMMEVETEIPRDKLEGLSRFLNERLSGLSLEQIRESFVDRVKDVHGEGSGLIRLFIDSVDKLFAPQRTEKLHIAGTDAIVEQPEFDDPKNFRGIIELINNEEIIIHVLEKSGQPTGVRVTIGQENDDRKLKDYSVITTTYTVGNVEGRIGVIGPTRMNYARTIPLVDYVAKTISEMFSSNLRS